MEKTTFKITKMDCPSEEQMIRMKLESYAQVKYLDFDIPNRKLEVYHVDGIEDIQTSIAGLNLGDSLEGTTEAEPPVMEDQSKQKKNPLVGLGHQLWFFRYRNDHRLDFLFYGTCGGFVGYAGRFHRICAKPIRGRRCHFKKKEGRKI